MDGNNPCESCVGSDSNDEEPDRQSYDREAEEDGPPPPPMRDAQGDWADQRNNAQGSTASGSISSTSDGNGAVAAAPDGNANFSGGNATAAATTTATDSWRHSSFDSTVRQQQETLMTVYENMTHSSTPQQQEDALTNIQTNATLTATNESTQQQQQQQLPSWSYKTGGIVGNIPIPPVPDIPSVLSGNLTGGGGGVARSRSGRTLRKRVSDAAAGPNGGDSGKASVDDTASTTSGGSRGSAKRKKSSSGKASSRRKVKNGGGKDAADGRWSKRFTWPEELHRDFVSAVFDVGLKHASPSTIIEQMPSHGEITVERIKSHLQKYRVHRAKSKRDFMTCYDASLSKMQQEGGIGTFRALSSGEVPAHLAYASLTGQEVDEAEVADAIAEAAKPNTAGSGKRSSTRRGSGDAKFDEEVEQQQDLGYVVDNRVVSEHQDSLVLPRLTDEEKRSPIGASMGYLMGLFFSLKQQLMAQRASAKEQARQQHMDVPSLGAMAPGGTKHNLPVADVFESFSDINHPQPHSLQQPYHPQYEAAPCGIVGMSAPTRGALMAPPAVAPQASAPTSVANPSTRSNLEESNMMKAEMQNQMAFQNKMRALKQQEVNKYRRHSSGESDPQYHQQQHIPYQREDVFPDIEGDAPGGAAKAAADAAEYAEQDFQGAGETAAADEGGQHTRDRSRGLSFGVADSDFWNTDVMDEQLFEFLMNN